MTKDNINSDKLIKYARQAQKNAYAPYSHYEVGAAVLGDNGSIYTGSNIENAVYPLASCAERVAITKAVSEGVKRILAVAVVTKNGGTPCGSCRQIMREFAADDLPVYISNLDGQYELHTLGELLPHSFTAVDLEKNA